ncbi:hypothetical protein RAS1_35810 [Phycisphaerae bacterium RAS1]|nr:hypothetical protein RAS1_35810 [Phycisphaerae bacterium RAS1]
MDFTNDTALESARLHELFVRYTHPYPHERLCVRVRYSRRSAFSGSCYYREGRIFINLGRRNRYPYVICTHVARARSFGTHWRREAYKLTVTDAYELALFIYRHELFHHLVHAAGRCVRRKESMCDRFATRVLVDHFACPLLDSSGSLVARAAWDFQDLDGFVSAAAPPILRNEPAPLAAEIGPLFAAIPRAAAIRPIPVTIRL